MGNRAYCTPFSDFDHFPETRTFVSEDDKDINVACPPDDYAPIRHSVHISSYRPWLGNSVTRSCYPPPIYGRFHQIGDMTQNYPKAPEIMSRLEGDNWFNESFHDLHDEDALWGFAMVTSKRMGLRMKKEVDDYPILNRLIRMGINDVQG